jgi:RNA polymerase sigma-32 factor
VDKVKARQENRFSTYAIWWMKAEIKEFIIENWSMVRPSSSTNIKKMFFSLRSIRVRIEREFGSNTNPGLITAELARHFNVPSNKVEEMQGRLAADLHIEDDGFQSDQFYVESHENDVIGKLDAEKKKRMIHEALGKLSERERDIIISRRLCDKEDRENLKDIGLRLGISGQRVMQIEASGMKKLKIALEGVKDQLL